TSKHACMSAPYQYGMRCGAKNANTTSAGAAICTEVSIRAMALASASFARAAVAAEVIARTDRCVEPVRSRGAEVQAGNSRVKIFARVLTEPIHLMLR